MYYLVELNDNITNNSLNNEKKEINKSIVFYKKSLLIF